MTQVIIIIRQVWEALPIGLETPRLPEGTLIHSPIFSPTITPKHTHSLIHPANICCKPNVLEVGDVVNRPTRSLLSQSLYSRSRMRTEEPTGVFDLRSPFSKADQKRRQMPYIMEKCVEVSPLRSMYWANTLLVVRNIYSIISASLEKLLNVFAPSIPIYKIRVCTYYLPHRVVKSKLTNTCKVIGQCMSQDKYTINIICTITSSSSSSLLYSLPLSFNQIP